jgi:hypothetical protein
MSLGSVDVALLLEMLQEGGHVRFASRGCSACERGVSSVAGGVYSDFRLDIPGVRVTAWLVLTFVRKSDPLGYLMGVNTRGSHDRAFSIYLLGHPCQS